MLLLWLAAAQGCKLGGLSRGCSVLAPGRAVLPWTYALATSAARKPSSTSPCKQLPCTC